MPPAAIRCRNLRIPLFREAEQGNPEKAVLAGADREIGNFLFAVNSLLPLGGNGKRANPYPEIGVQGEVPPPLDEKQGSFPRDAAAP